MEGNVGSLAGEVAVGAAVCPLIFPGEHAGISKFVISNFGYVRIFLLTRGIQEVPGDMVNGDGVVEHVFRKRQLVGRGDERRKRRRVR